MGALQQAVRPFFISSPQAKKNSLPHFYPKSPTYRSHPTHTRYEIHSTAFSLASIFPFLGYNGAPLRPQNENTSSQKQKLVINITLMTDLG